MFVSTNVSQAQLRTRLEPASTINHRPVTRRGHHALRISVGFSMRLAMYYQDIAVLKQCDLNFGNQQNFGDQRVKPALFKVFLAYFGLFFALSTALADDDKFTNRLLFNDPDGGSTPIIWEFDPTSGFTLGSGIELVCLRADLVFNADGTVAFIKGRPDEEGCTGTGPMLWALAPNAELGTLGITMSDGGAPCAFAVKFGSVSDSLKLTTFCNQAPGHPRQFRYFPANSEGPTNE